MELLQAQQQQIALPRQGAIMLPARAAVACRSAALQHEACSTFKGLSEAQIQQFHEDGFLPIPGFADDQQVAGMISRANKLVDGFDPEAENRRYSVFTTKEEQTHAKDAYFLDSASEVSFFFEEKAFNENGQLRQPKALSINKMGHAMHDLDPVFRAFARSQPVAAVLQSLGYRRPLPVQSMYIFKQPNIGGEVTPHQDSTFLITDPPSCIGLWLALEDANLTNGCLWGLKGIHKQGIARRFKRLPQGGVGFDGPAAEYDLSQFEPIECPAGTLVLLHGANVHYSAENASPVSRHSFTMHFVESGPGYEWAADNWAHRKPEMPWEPLYDLTQQ
eukprot:GHRR01008251.1.p1 GENE.GHRR01008251.1~~GHRR01008251.1.p1  ORF type:complete len:333 (+),score=97.86 GHRR01008251.1:181-1179(+)